MPGNMLRKQLEQHPWRTVIMLSLGVWVVMMVVDQSVWAAVSAAETEMTSAVQRGYCIFERLLTGIFGRFLTFGALAAGAGLYFTGSKGAGVGVAGVGGIAVLAPYLMDLMFGNLDCKSL